MGECEKRNLSAAMMLNALVFPGIGHFYLGMRLKGAVMAIMTAVFIIVPVAKFAVLSSYAINIMKQTGTSPVFSMLRTFSEVWPLVRTTVLLAILGIVIIWTYGMADVWLIIRKHKQDE